MGSCRDELLKDLHDLQEEYLYFGDANGYGPSAQLYAVSSGGVAEYGPITTLPWEGPFEISAGEAACVKAAIEEGTADEDDDPAMMFKAGCTPGVKYYRWCGEWQGMMDDAGYYLTEREMETMFIDYMSCGDVLFTPWEDMGESELEAWANVVEGLKRGQNDW